MANYDITMTDLEEYRTNRPIAEALKSKNMELEKLKIRIVDMEAMLRKREYEWHVSQDEFEHVSTELERPIDPPELYELAKELYRHPSKHTDVIRTMRQRIRTIVLQKRERSLQDLELFCAACSTMERRANATDTQ